MSERERALYTVAGLRALERLACAELGIASSTLMERAGAAAYRFLRERWPDAERIVVVCGAGNNAGDGYVLARLARADMREVCVLQLGAPASQGDAVLAFERLTAGATPIVTDLDLLNGLGASDVIVDAVFGIGLNRAIEGSTLAAITAVNDARCVRLSVDVPSGLHAESGTVMGGAVRADATISFIANKIGLVTGVARDYVGALEIDSLDVPLGVFDDIAPRARLYDWEY